MPAISIKPYCERWPDDFAQSARHIRQIMPPGSRLHHIGSTAVPGLAAKDVIDIQLTVPSLAAFAPESAAAKIGFAYVPTITGDHCPPGTTLTQEELAKYFLRGSIRPVNLHVREAGRFNQRYALLCRDYLRTHPVVAGAYALIKKRLAERSPEDIDFYYDIKDPVFDILMEGANEWARTSAWLEPKSDLD